MVQEVQRLLDEGISHERLEALGLEYRYITRLLRGEFKNEDEMVQKLKYAIHDFTRRQLTWFRKDKRIVWVNGGDWEQAEEVVRNFLNE
jgi:tRNA dimethylallyltransferase